MIRKIVLLGILGLSLNLAGCGKAEIVSECSLAGNGDYRCNFRNNGTAEGGSCIHLILGTKPQYLGAASFSIFDDQLNFIGHFGKFLRDQAQAGNEPKIEDFILPINENPLSKEQETKHMMEIIKEIFIGSKKSTDQSILEKYKATIASTVLKPEGKVMSNEICSGLIRAGDVRTVNGLAYFSSGLEYLHSLRPDASPSDLCGPSALPPILQGRLRYSWSDVCEFSTIKSEELKDFLKKKVEEAKK